MLGCLLESASPVGPTLRSIDSWPKLLRSIKHGGVTILTCYHSFVQICVVDGSIQMKFLFFSCEMSSVWTIRWECSRDNHMGKAAVYDLLHFNGKGYIW